jgi:sorbitol-specific phosphotransferase system component IIC
MVLLNDHLHAFANGFQHGGEVVSDFVVCHVNVAISLITAARP